MLRFDHAIISVDDLMSAVEDFAAQGFMVLPGGRHAAGTTHNALVCFGDGAYLELMALTGDEPQGEGQDYSFILKSGEGFVGCALASDNLQTEVKAMQARGLTIADPEAGGRLRPDGAVLRWQTAFIGSSFSPFLIEDVTARNLRVPDDEKSITHENGAAGIAEVLFLAANMNSATKRLRDITGVEAVSDGVAVKFPIEGCVLSVRAPEDEAERVYTVSRPDAPYEIVLRASGEAGLLTIAHTHYARLRLRGDDADS